MKAVRAKILYTGKPGEVLNDVYVIFDERRILDVSKEKPKDVEVIEAKVVTPALIDAHSHIGMVRHGEPSDEKEANEKFETIVPHADALYSIYLDDKAFKESIEHGVLYSCILPGSGNIIGGRAVLIRNYGRDIEEAFIKYTGVKAALGYNPRSTVDWKGTRPYTRMGAIAILRKWLEKAKDSLKLIEKGKKEFEEIEPELRYLFPIIEGKEVLRVHVHKADDVAGLLLLKREFGLELTVEHLCDVDNKITFEKLKRENVPIVYGPVDAFAYKTELKHEYWRNIRHLVNVKPLFGLMSDHPVILQRNIFLQLRFFRRFGMNKSECISLLSYNNAKILGVENRLGSLERGKWPSMVLWSDDPFSLDSYPVMVIGEGKVIYEEK